MLTLTFDQARVPCDASALGELYERASEHVTYWRACGYTAPAATWGAFVDARPADPTDGDAAYRHFLALRRAVGRGATRWLVEDLLEIARSHSALRTPRTCRCLHRAWEQYTSELAGAWPHSNALAWVVSDPTGAARVTTRPGIDDVLGSLRRRPAEHPLWRYRSAAPDRVTFTLEPHAVTMVARRGRASAELTWVRLDKARTHLALRFADPVAAACVRDWPDAAIDLADALAHHPRCMTLTSELARAITEHRFNPSPAAVSTALALAPTWTGSIEELLRAADVVAA